MRDLLPFVITGLATGSLYGLAALGLTLTYRTTGIFNFAHGAVGTAAAYFFYELRVRNNVPTAVALAACLLVAAPTAGLLLERLSRPLLAAPVAARITATVGLLLIVQGTATTIFGSAAINFAPLFPTRGFDFAGVTVGVDQILTTILAASIALGLGAFLRLTPLGLAMRAVVDNEALLDLMGTTPVAVRRKAWIVGSILAGLSGILLAPSIGLDAILLTLLVVQAFGAAAVGRFTSLPLSYAGGLLVGVGAALATKLVSGRPSIAGLPASVPFLVLFIVLVATPPRRAGVEAARRRPKRTRRIDGTPAKVGAAVTLGAALLVPTLVGARLPVYTNAAIMVVLFVSLRLLVFTSGQVSLCHAAFVAIGASTFSHLTHGLGLPWMVALLGAGLAAVPVGAIIAVPAIRLSGIYLALATFGFGILLERMAFGTGMMFGKLGIRTVPRPDLGFIDLTGDRGFYYVCLAVAVVSWLAVRAVTRSRLGRLLRSLADSPLALTTAGANVNITRVLVFSLCSFFAAIAGALLGALTGSIGGGGFNAIQSLLWVTVLALAGGGQLVGPVVAAVALTVMPAYITNPTFIDLQPVLFGLTALLATLVRNTEFDLTAWLAQARDRHVWRTARSPVVARRSAGVASLPDPAR